MRNTRSFCIVFLSIIVTLPSLHANNLTQTHKIDSLLQLLPRASKAEKAHIYSQLSVKYLQLNPHKTIDFAKKGLQLSHTIGNDSLKAINFNTLGNAYDQLGQYDSAIQFQMDALDTYKAMEHPIGRAKTFHKIGVIYWNIEKTDKALEYFNKSMKIYNRLGDKTGISENMNSIASIFFDQNKLDKSLLYLEQSLKINRSSNDLENIATTLNNIGLIYKNKKQYDKAFEHYRKSIQVKEKLGDRKGKIYSLKNIGDLYFEREQYHKALEYYQNGLEIAKDVDAKRLTAKYYNSISEVCFKSGAYKKAYKFKERYQTIRDTIYSQQSQERIAKIQSKFELKEKQQQIEMLSKEKEMEEKNNRILTFSFITISVFLILLIAVIYNRYKLKNRSNKILQEEIEEHKKTSEKLQASEERLKLAMQGSNDGLWDWDLVHDTLFHSPRWKKMLGYQDAEVPEDYLHWEQRIHPDDIKHVKKKIREHLEIKTSTYENSYRLQHKKGHYIWVLDRGKAILNEENKPVRMVGTHTDITEKKKVENELKKYQQHLEELVEQRTKELKIQKEKAEKSDYLKSAFLANMSHEIRTPMNAIVGFADLLIDNELSENQKKDLIEHINKNTNDLLFLIDDIIDIAKIEADELEINTQQININQLLDDIYCAINKGKQLQKNPDVELVLTKEIAQPLHITSDNYRLKQIIYNLLSNAIKFTHEGTIEYGYQIKEENDKKSLCFFVKDTGIGIKKEQSAEIFNRFNKLETDKTKIYSGTGLGLSIAKSLIEKLGGKIWVESEVGVGSTFYFTHPYT